ncbi:hypothetical protein HND97_01540 [Vibrio cholerae]|nr:hypothetical protein HND97_01540 [Vibrio cholerae]
MAARAAPGSVEVSLSANARRILPLDLPNTQAIALLRRSRGQLLPRHSITQNI